MGIVSGRIDLIYGLLLVIATQLTLVALGCTIKPDAMGMSSYPMTSHLEVEHLRIARLCALLFLKRVAHTSRLVCSINVRL